MDCRQEVETEVAELKMFRISYSSDTNGQDQE